MRYMGVHLIDVLQCCTPNITTAGAMCNIPKATKRLLFRLFYIQERCGEYIHERSAIKRRIEYRYGRKAFMQGAVKISDIPKGAYVNDTEVIINTYKVYVIKHPTGFGQRRYFLCPSCGTKCGKLYVDDGYPQCRQCTPINPYRHRQNMYDGGGQDLITWHMYKIFHRIFPGKHIDWPFDCMKYMPDKPKYMSYEKYRIQLLKLQTLENMRCSAIFHGYRATGATIRQYTRKEFVGRFVYWQLKEYFIFGRGIPPEDFAVLLDERHAPAYVKQAKERLRNMQAGNRVPKVPKGYTQNGYP